MAQNYDVNYEDERFTNVEADKEAALSDLEQTYNGMIGESDKYYQAQIDASKQWADTQSQLQQEQTDFTIEQVEQQKAQAQKDYTKEQSGAYVDWRKQSNQYGTEAEKMASSGLANTGYSESSQVSMYNTYQNRVATAREVYNQAVLNYDNAIKDARLQNNAALAEIAYQALQQQLDLSLQGFQYKNQLMLDQANKKLEVDQTYYNRYQDVLAQLNRENEFAEQVRQYNKNYELQTKEYEESVRQFNENIQLQRQRLDEEFRQFNDSYELQKAQYKEGIRQFNEEIERLKNKDEKEYKLQIESLQLEKNKLQESQRQWEEEMAFERQKYQDQKDMLNSSKSSSNSSKSIKSSKKTDPTKDKNDSYTQSTLDSKSVNDLDIGPVNDEYLADLYIEGGITIDEKGRVEKTEKFDTAKAIVDSSAKTKIELPTNYLTPENLAKKTTTKTTKQKTAENYKKLLDRYKGTIREE